MVNRRNGAVLTHSTPRMHARLHTTSRISSHGYGFREAVRQPEGERTHARTRSFRASVTIRLSSSRAHHHTATPGVMPRPKYQVYRGSKFSELSYAPGAFVACHPSRNELRDLRDHTTCDESASSVQYAFQRSPTISDSACLVCRCPHALKSTDGMRKHMRAYHKVWYAEARSIEGFRWTEYVRMIFGGDNDGVRFEKLTTEEHWRRVSARCTHPRRTPIEHQALA